MSGWTARQRSGTSLITCRLDFCGSAPYNPDGEDGILWNDPTLAIPWPIRDPIVSTRDKTMPTFAAHRLAHAT